jgi:hypothetical protein
MYLQGGTERAKPRDARLSGNGASLSGDNGSVTIRVTEKRNGKVTELHLTEQEAEELVEILGRNLARIRQMRKKVEK